MTADKVRPYRPTGYSGHLLTVSWEVPTYTLWFDNPKHPGSISQGCHIIIPPFSSFFNLALKTGADIG